MIICLLFTMKGWGQKCSIKKKKKKRFLPGGLALLHAMWKKSVVWSDIELSQFKWLCANYLLNHTNIQVNLQMRLDMFKVTHKISNIQKYVHVLSSNIHLHGWLMVCFRTQFWCDMKCGWLWRGSPPLVLREKCLNTCRSQDQSLKQIRERDDSHHHILCVHQH